MSSNYFFTKWKETLTHLEHIVHVDLEYQETKAHDKKRCEAVARLCGVLGEYIVAYNATLDCLQNNLQVQKTEYIRDILKAVTSRSLITNPNSKKILELKNQIRKLECSNTQFLGHGLANHKLTAYDAELDDVPSHTERPDNVKTSLAEAFVKAEEKRELLRIAEEEGSEYEQTEAVNKWWDEDEVSEEEIVEQQEPEAEEMMETRRMVSLIQSHERSRQLIRMMNCNNHKRQLWEKELLGTLKPPAPLELRVRAAKLIQKVCRTYFEIKRRKRHDCQQDERIGIRLCGKVDNSYLKKVFEIKRLRCDQRKVFENQWQESRERLKQDFIKRKTDAFADDYRDFIREWFKKWFDDIHYFYDIPAKEEGGSVLIMKEDTPEPIEWWDQYKAYLEQKRANKGKTSHQLKMEKMAAKQEEMMRKKEELTKKRLENELMRKIMKNPTLHPGFHFPESKKSAHILEVLENYHKDWDEWDKTEALEVKKKFVIDIDKSYIYAEAKMDMMQTVDDEMREELKVLKTALKTDYENNGDKFPEPMNIPKKRAKKKKRVRAKMSESIAEKMEDLAFKGILKKYHPKKLGEFLGDHNYAGDDQRCNYEPALQFCGETRSIWWDRCREATHGYHKLLLVGPRRSGKTLLVHILCTVNVTSMTSISVLRKAKQEEMMRKKEELTKKRLENELMRKIMKNPTLHPGFHFPESKKSAHILEVLENYHKDWDEWDKTEALEVKKKFVIDIDKSYIYAEAKMDMMQTVDDEMREELKVLKTALKTDYENNGDKFPEPMNIPKKRAKKKKRVRAKMSESIAEKMEDLAFKGILKKYHPKKLGEFLGDHNYAGDDQRCNYEPALQFCGETRSIWWDRCREATHGYHKLLLVGPRRSGKTLLVHILCTVNDAVLFELDPAIIHNLNLSPAELLKIANAVVICARAAQPSVIYFKHIHRLFYKKAPPEEADVNLAQMKRFFIKLLKKINKADKITVVGSCVDPWVTNSNKLLKQFPLVVLVPDTSYSSVYSMLSCWVNDNHTLPRDLDINSLARVLRGYSYGHLQEGLQNFLTAERIVKIAARGLFPMEIYDFFLEDETKEKVEYEKYLKWYAEKTAWGKKERHHMEEQLEFRLLSEKYAEKAEKEKKKPASGASSATTLPSAATD